MSAWLALALSTAVAQGGEHGLTFGAGAGYLWTDPNENLADTWAVVPRLGYDVARHASVELDIGVHQGQTRSFGYGYTATTPRLNLLVYLVPGGAVQPFLAAGPGVIHKNVNRDAGTWEETPKDGEDFGNYKNPDTDVIVNGGPGTLIKLGGPLFLRLDGRVVFNIGSEPHGNIPDQFTDYEVTAGMMFRGVELKRDTDKDSIVDRIDQCIEDPEDWDDFEDPDGCPDPDNDQDGILDAEDECPNRQEDFDEWEDEDGCPDKDNDHDGFLDHEDACPYAAEDQDGFGDQDGCPDGDNDGDGIVDLEDGCPNKPEDRDGFQDEDGCPDPDNDGDGLADNIDSCPMDPEIYNGFDDEDGCPDDRPPELERFNGVIHGINFHVDSDRITVDSYRILNEAAAVLVAYPQIRLEVQGHTDGDGSDAYNLDLSARRAKSVVAYMVGRGVTDDRLEWIGWGERKPLMDEASPDAKAVNRRVEFHIIEDGQVDGGL